MAKKPPEHIVQRIADAYDTLGSYEAAAEHFDLPEEVVRRVHKGRALQSENYQLVMDKVGAVPLSPDPYWDGVKWAAESMNETVGKLLRAERLARERYALRDKAAATLRAASAGDPAASGTPTPHPRQASG